MKNSKVVAPCPKARKATKEERRRSKRKQFITMVSVVFIILFIFSMCISVVAERSGDNVVPIIDFRNHIGEANISNENTQKNENSYENENLGIIYTYNVTNPELFETENLKTTELLTENSAKIQIETTELKMEEITETTEKVKSYTKYDLFYLAAAVCREAGGESEEIQLLVANVIINRVNSSIYPDTIYEVLTQYRQYGTMWKYGVSFPDWADEKVKEQCYSVAQRVLEGERFCPENVLFQAEFKQGSGIFKQFGDDYYFCYYD